MAHRMRVVMVQRGQTTRVHVPHQEVPIIIVPGIMGSRLTDPKTDELAWNPMGAPLSSNDNPSANIFRVAFERLSQVSAPLVPDETHPYDQRSKHEEIAHIKHWYNIIPEFYGAIAKALSRWDDPKLTELKIKTKVYCCGYDWRVDNAKSAMRLSAVVEEALAETGAQKVILVAHSMGGLVSRYYCRVLGGESKVHQLILVGSPTLGSPSAYAQLRSGAYGLYLKDLMHPKEINEGDEEVQGNEAVTAIASGITALNTVASAGVGAGIKNFLGDLLLALSLGAGRYLMRTESRYFCRQLPALYQLLPNSVFCEKYKHWIWFDPLATGHRPAGFMVKLPSLLEAALGAAVLVGDLISSSAGTEAKKLKDSVLSTLDSSQFNELSGRAHRNVMDVAELVVAAKKLYDNDKTGDAVKLLVELYEHADRAFIDCRNPRLLYNDIYAGLMDIVSLRPLVARNLEVAFQFDAALTVDFREPEKASAAEMVKNLIKPLFALLGDLFAGAVKGADKKAMRAFLEEEKAANPPKVYMHPRTVNIHCGDLPGDPGVLVFPRSVVSRDDSNLVRVQVLPVPGALPSFLLPPGMTPDVKMGDSTVPLPSAMPADDQISAPWSATDTVSKTPHAAMMGNEVVMTAVKKRILDAIAEFPRG